MIWISSAFDGGNIIVHRACAPDDIELAIAKDAHADFAQWFYFRVSGVRGADCVLRIVGLDQSSYPHGWPDYRACASVDRENWFRVETVYANDTLTIRHRARSDSVYFAYFAPYSMERHHDLIARVSAHAVARHAVIGRTLDGQDIDLVTLGMPTAGKKTCWLIARQHPGETMAEWWMEGALARLADPADPVSRALLEKAVFYVVPNMNPDGSRRGHLRTNAAGVNLNREWHAPSPERSPEVLCVRNHMDRTGVDFFLDVHGDESLPYNFIAGFDGIPSLTQAQGDLLARYRATLARLSPDFQTEKGYPPSPPGKANLSMAGNQIAERFGCLSGTLEMPFKDTAATPDPVHGWSPARARALARACLDALHLMIDDLRR
ncbi:MAG: hypothetical protein D6782_07965 [Alphaproteobacteria bacterium]|nr:MAG: hypothetical protein D6782_07965 [Alphaproteobacteria bacterium]